MKRWLVDALCCHHRESNTTTKKEKDRCNLQNRFDDASEYRSRYSTTAKVCRQFDACVFLSIRQ